MLLEKVRICDVETTPGGATVNPPPHDYIHERLCSRLIWNLDLNRTAR